MECLEYICPAKLNLFLEVRHKRDDGYHEIETVMQTVSICDKLKLFEITSGIEIQSNASWLPEGKDNLAFKAAQVFFDKIDRKAGVRIEIDKRIPPGQGLGGGSSNAAGVLAGLNKLCKTGFTQEQLAEMAAEIGSDAPFFIYGGTAVCRGRGETIKPLHIPHTFSYVVIMPELTVPTSDVYQHMRDKGYYPDDPMNSEEVVYALEQGDTELLCQCLFNRLEGSAFGKFPELEALYQEILKVGDGEYRLTGSGSAFYLPVLEKEEGLKEMRRLASLRKLYSCEVVYCEGNVRGTSYGNYRSEID